MNFFIHFIFFSSISILIVESIPVDLIKEDIESLVGRGLSTHKLKLIPLEYLGETQLSLVWKGSYKGETVAVKINTNEILFNAEMKAFKALNAIDDVNIESHGIPRVYFSGKFTYKYRVIAMTLLDETLENRIIKLNMERKKISELSILLIFKRAVEILEYLNEKKVVHNDIKPANIFLRDSEVFLGDFNLASVDGVIIEGVPSQSQTAWFASSRFYSDQTRYAMDDLESLVYSLWYVAGVPWDKPSMFSNRRPEGMTLAECKINGTAKAKVTEKSKHFRNPHVQEAFKLCAFEMLEEKHVPDYRLLVNILTNAIRKIHGEYGTPQFEWLEGDDSYV